MASPEDICCCGDFRSEHDAETGTCRCCAALGPWPCTEFRFSLQGISGYLYKGKASERRNHFQVDRMLTGALLGATPEEKLKIVGMIPKLLQQIREAPRWNMDE